jgi:aminopeptidase N
MIVGITLGLPPLEPQARPDALELREAVTRTHRILEATHQLRRSDAKVLELPVDPVHAAAQEEFDVLHYTLDLRIRPFAPANYISGSVEVVLEPTGPFLDQVVLDLNGQLSVTAVERTGGVPAGFSHADEELAIDLDPPLVAGQVDTLVVSYSGSPVAFDFDGFEIYRLHSPPVVWTISEPSSARDWWPCKDRPDDKSTVDVLITMDDRFTVASNGLIEAITENPDGTKTHHWHCRYLLPAYLVAFTATNFVVLEDQYELLEGGTLPLYYYTWPESESRVARDIVGIPDMLHIFETEYFPYPFAEEKYGHMEAPIPGAMEHTTMTTYGTWLYSGDRRNDPVAAHELSHHWWGDYVTCGTWDDIWLNEGFATYSEAIWAEGLWGYDAYLEYMLALAEPSFPGPIYDPNGTFNSTVYQKGAWILHMLRGIVGREELLQIMRRWGTDYGDQSPVTADFVALCEEEVGHSMAWFFDPWLYHAGRPVYRYGIRIGHDGDSRSRIDFEISQIQGGVNPYVMPITLRIELADGGFQDEIVWNTQSHQHLQVEIDGRAVAVVPDPEHYILADFNPSQWTGIEEMAR